MSMLSAQIGKLRHESDILRDHGTFIGYGGLTSTDHEMIECADLMCEAADTITELRGALLIAGADYRQLSDENAKLRDSLKAIMMGTNVELCADRDEPDCKECSMHHGKDGCTVVDAMELLSIDMYGEPLEVKS